MNFAQYASAALAATLLLVTAMPARAADEGATLSPIVRVMTVNAAHGRKDSLNQLLLGRGSIQSNLGDLASTLTRSGPDLVALQEADGPSRWSGSFDHVNALARQAGFAWRFRGDHAQSWLYRYGTALLSHLPLTATHSVRFEPSPPSPRKGFVIGEMRWPGSDEDPGEPRLAVDVVSVHFDYLSQAARERQLRQLTQTLQRRSNPRIVLGDFNSEWNAPDSMVQRLASQTTLQAFEPLAADHATYGERRIDWILISPEFRFHGYETLPDVISDHRAVVADIGLARRPGRPATAAPPADPQAAD